jgi:hypothetical protein
LRRGVVVARQRADAPSRDDRRRVAMAARLPACRRMRGLPKCPATARGPNRTRFHRLRWILRAVGPYVRQLAA